MNFRLDEATALLEHGERRAFEPFDRFAQLREPKRPLDALLDEFARLRGKSLAELAELGLTEADLERRGRHPELGTVTLAQLLANWVAHELDHVFQIARTMARRYAQDVGPWTAYSRILRC